MKGACTCWCFSQAKRGKVFSIPPSSHLHQNIVATFETIDTWMRHNDRDETREERETHHVGQ